MKKKRERKKKKNIQPEPVFWGCFKVICKCPSVHPTVLRWSLPYFLLQCSLYKNERLPNLSFKSKQALSILSKGNQLSVFGDRRTCCPEWHYSYLRHSWKAIPSSHDCPMWNSHFLSQTWNSLVCVLNTEPSHLQGSEPWNVQVQIENTCVLQSFQEVFSNHWAKHTRMYKYIVSANRRIFCFIIFFCFYQEWREHIRTVSWAGYCVLLAVIILPKVNCLFTFFFPLRCTWVLFFSKVNMPRV